MAKIEVLRTIEFEDGYIDIVFRPKQNKGNLTKALLHIKSIVHGRSITKNGKCRDHLYGKNEANWARVKRDTLRFIGVFHIEDIPINRIDEANEYAIALIDKIYKQP